MNPLSIARLLWLFAVSEIVLTLLYAAQAALAPGGLLILATLALLGLCLLALAYATWRRTKV